jgi:septum formation inhibitor MinC
MNDQHTIETLTNMLNATKAQFEQADQAYHMQKQANEQLRREINILVLEAELYRVLINAIEENENLQDAWTDLMMMFKLTVPGAEDKFNAVLRTFPR